MTKKYYRYNDERGQVEWVGEGNFFEPITDELALKADKTELFSGSYNDLTNKPSIPSATDVAKGVTAHSWGDHSVAGYAKDSDLHTVAKSGDYNDLDNKPAIPTNTSDLSNDSSFISDAPQDGKGYARKDGDWEEVESGGVEWASLSDDSGSSYTQHKNSKDTIILGWGNNGGWSDAILESVSLGYDTESRSYAVSIGFESVAYNFAVAVGRGAKVTSNDGLAIGDRAQTSGTGISIGKNSKSDRGIAIGRGADSGKDNTVNGSIAIGGSSSTGGDDSIAIGTRSKNEWGVNCIALGRQAEAYSGYSIALGTNSKAGGSDAISIGRDSVCTNFGAISLGKGASCSGMGSVALGEDAEVSGSNQIQLGNSSTTTYVYGTVQVRSDARDKADIKDSNLGLDFINRLRPVSFVYDYRDSYREKLKEETREQKESSQEEKGKGLTQSIKKPFLKTSITDVDKVKLSDIQPDGSLKRSRPHYGLIAQEVKQVMDDLGVDFGGYQDHTKTANGEDVLSLGYSEFIAPLIKAVQELSARVEELEKEVVNEI